MNSMQSTARKLDKFFRIAAVIMNVGIMACIAALLIIAAGAIFPIPADLLGDGQASVELGFLTITMADSAAPTQNQSLLTAAVSAGMAIVTLWLSRRCILSIRTILKPMAEGLPFDEPVGSGLKALARQVIALGIVQNVAGAASQAVTAYAFKLPESLLSDRITDAVIGYQFDLSFILFGAILFLLAYVFRYGAQLQRQVDETL